jgi:DNA primase
MNNYTLIAEAIKERVSMRDAIALYAPTPAPKHNRIPCPVHGGKNYNLSFTDKFYHCFVCGSGGDVIHFVQHVFGIPFIAALDKLNTDFNCGAILDRRPTLREQREAQQRHDALMAERERQEAEKQAHEDLYAALWNEWCRLDRNRIDYAPQSTSDEWHPLFVEALHKLDYQSYLIDTLL